LSIPHALLDPRALVLGERASAEGDLARALGRLPGPLLNARRGAPPPSEPPPKAGCAGEAGAGTEHQSLTADLAGTRFSDRLLARSEPRLGAIASPPGTLFARLDLPICAARMRAISAPLSEFLDTLSQAAV